MIGARRIRSDKLREDQYIKGYARSLEEERVEWNGDNDAKNMWEQVKRPMVGSTSGLWLSESVWWKDEIKVAIKRKKAAWKEVYAASDEEAK